MPSCKHIAFGLTFQRDSKCADCNFLCIRVFGIIAGVIILTWGLSEYRRLPLSTIFDFRQHLPIGCICSFLQQSPAERPEASQKKYFEVGSCSNLGDAQARRLKIRVNGENGKYFAHTLNNTVVAPPRMLIAFLENNLQADGSVRIPEVLQPYMGGMKEIRKK